MLAITTGLRRGELLGLRWDDANLDRVKLWVGRALVRGHATIAMTLDTYSHYLPSMVDQASGAMGDVLG